MLRTYWNDHRHQPTRTHSCWYSFCHRMGISVAFQDTTPGEHLCSYTAPKRHSADTGQDKHQLCNCLADPEVLIYMRNSHQTCTAHWYMEYKDCIGVSWLLLFWRWTLYQDWCWCQLSYSPQSLQCELARESLWPGSSPERAQKWAWLYWGSHWCWQWQSSHASCRFAAP